MNKLLRKTLIGFNEIFKQQVNVRTEFVHTEVKEFVNVDAATLTFTINGDKLLVKKLEQILKVECYKFMAETANVKPPELTQVVKHISGKQEQSNWK